VAVSIFACICRDPVELGLSGVLPDNQICPPSVGTITGKGSASRLARAAKQRVAGSQQISAGCESLEALNQGNRFETSSFLLPGAGTVSAVLRLNGDGIVSRGLTWHIDLSTNNST
jgi:hypothetical protein